MCVIFLVNKARPSDEMIERAWDSNKDGAGIAWREGAEVVWKKGITTAAEVKTLAKKLPMPYVIHFRVASVGGVKPTLTHPFIINKDVTLELEGRTKGAILFHNGHWGMWNDRVLEAAIHANKRIPLGPDWSDTRGMAWMIHLYGSGFMNLLTSQKGIIMTPQNLEIFTGNGWDRVNDVWCSNDYFWSNRGHRGHSGGHFQSNYGHRLCIVGKCQNRAQTGKEMCDKCEREHTPDTSTGDSKSDSEDHTLAIVTGGSKRPLARLFTLKEMEDLNNHGRVSRSKFKKFRKLYNNIGKGGNRELRALKQLEEITRDVAEKLAAGLAS